MLNNSTALVKELEALGFWNTDGVGVNKNNTLTWKTAENLTLVFSPDKQPWGGIYSQEKKQSVSSFDIDSNEAGDIQLKIWIDESYSKDPMEFRSLLLRTFFDAVYISTHWESVESENHLGYLNLLIKKAELPEFISIFNVKQK